MNDNILPQDLEELLAGVMDSQLSSISETPALTEDSEVNNESITTDSESLEDNILENYNRIIPENSRTLLIDEYTSRFTDAIWYKEAQNTDVLLAGVGGIGSYVAFLLSRLKIRRLVIYDPDIVEAANMSGQLYGTSSIGQYKVSSIYNIIRDFSNYHAISTYSREYDSSCTNSRIMICGFDNMAARKVFFNRWLDYVHRTYSPEKCLYIDGRLAAEEFQVLAIQGNDDRAIEEYTNKWLFDDSEAEATICSYKQTTFMANMIATYMVNIFVNFIANISEEKPIIPRDIPFFISYNAETMFTKVEM